MLENAGLNALPFTPLPLPATALGLQILDQQPGEAEVITIMFPLRGVTL